MPSSQNIVSFIKDWFGLVAIVVAVVSGLGFSFSPPWAAAADVETIQQQMLEIRRDLKDTGCLTLRVLLRGYQADRDAAEAELSVNPSSTTAKRAKAEAEEQIAAITVQIRDKCK